jgi:hypothetical protein
MSILGLTKRELSEAKIYILRRIAQDDFSELECREMVGLLKLSRSGLWAASLISELLCEYGAGERTTPQQVMVKLAESIDAIEAVAADPSATRRLIGKRPVRAREQPAAGSGGAGVRP